MKDYIEERAVEIANYIIDTKATVRQAAKKFGISKSTVHKDCTDRLSQLNPGLACEVRQVLDVNKQERLRYYLIKGLIHFPDQCSYNNAYYDQHYDQNQNHNNHYMES